MNCVRPFVMKDVLGIAKEVLHAAGKTGYQDRHALLPIPQDEIDKSNGVLVQNPNY